MAIGPVQLLVRGFNHPNFHGRSSRSWNGGGLPAVRWVHQPAGPGRDRADGGRGGQGPARHGDRSGKGADLSPAKAGSGPPPSQAASASPAPPQPKTRDEGRSPSWTSGTGAPAPPSATRSQAGAPRKPESSQRFTRWTPTEPITAAPTVSATCDDAVSTALGRRSMVRMGPAQLLHLSYMSPTKPLGVPPRGEWSGRAEWCASRDRPIDSVQAAQGVGHRQAAILGLGLLWDGVGSYPRAQRCMDDRGWSCGFVQAC
jgi:hypothetical protein